MNSQKNTKAKDLFSNFVNWFASIGEEKPPITREGGSQDLFSKLMNKISS